MAEEKTRTGLVAVLVTVAVPPALAGERGKQFIAQYPGWAVAIVVAYTVVGGFFVVIVREVAAR